MKFQRATVHRRPEIGSLEGLWWRVTPFNAAPWTALGVPEEPPPDPLLEEFWGPPIPLRATDTMTRGQARAREQARQQSIDDTVSIALFPLPETFRLGGVEFPVADNYVRGGAGERAVMAMMADGHVWVRFVQGNVGNTHDNYSALPGLVVQGHPNVLTGYQQNLLQAIDRDNDLDLANLKNADGDNVLDVDGEPIPIVWMPTIAPLWIRLCAEIERESAGDPEHG